MRKGWRDDATTAGVRAEEVQRVASREAISPSMAASSAARIPGRVRRALANVWTPVGGGKPSRLARDDGRSEKVRDGDRWPEGSVGNVMITGRERYEWLLPVANYGHAHAFCVGARLSMCVQHERFPYGRVFWEREELEPGEPRRARCARCTRLLQGFPNMVELS